MIWEKKGIIFRPKGQYGWMNSHAQVPTVLVKENENLVRVYFSSRPKPNLSLTSFVDLNIDRLNEIIYLNDKPILELGGPGSFDEHGIMPSSIIEKEGIIHLYYSGWSRGGSLPYNNYTGLALSEDGGKTFYKYSPGPIIDRTPFEIYSATSPCVFYENGEWHMYYSSGTHWHKINGRMEHTYDIKYASSLNGKSWNQNGFVIVPQKNPYEAITKPTIIKMNRNYHMWFCFRGCNDFRNGKESYRIGYSRSNDLINWNRMDNKAGIELPKEDWDSKMMAYPAVVQIRDEIIMFYNGNYFGKDGFGYSILRCN